MKKANFTFQNNPNYSSKNLIIMKKHYLLSKIAGILVLLVTLSLNAVGGTQKTPYAQLQEVLKLHNIYKDVVTAELTTREKNMISFDVATQFKVPEYTFQSAKTVGELLTSILTYKYDGKGGAEWEWRKIQYSTNHYHYVVYLSLYPKTKHYKEAVSKQIVTHLYKEWKKVDVSRGNSGRNFLSLNNLYSHMYNVSIRKYDCSDCDIPCIDYEGFSLINIRELVDAVQEQIQAYNKEIQIWKATLRENTHDAYWNYYLQYPQSRFADTALSKVTVFEQPAWDKAQENGTREAYETFIKEFPKGNYSSEAYNKIVRSHIDTTSFKAVDAAIMELCPYERPGYSTICIANVNNKNKTYTVTFSGKSGYRLTLLPGEYKWLEIEDGDYKILVEANGVKPWWSNKSCHGHTYAAAWYVGKESRNSLKKQSKLSSILEKYRGITSSPVDYEDTDDNPDIDQVAKKRFISAVLEQCNLK